MLKDDKEDINTYIPDVKTNKSEKDAVVNSSDEENEETTMMRMKVKINKDSHLYEEEHLIHTLYKLAHQDKSTPSSSKQSTDPNNIKWGENKQYLK